MANAAPFQSGTTTIGGAAASAIPGSGPGTWRVRVRNSGPVAVRVGDDTLDFDSGFLLAPDDPWLEILTDSVVYAIAPPNAAGIGAAQLDYLIETR